MNEQEAKLFRVFASFDWDDMPFNTNGTTLVRQLDGSTQETGVILVQDSPFPIGDLEGMHYFLLAEIVTDWRFLRVDWDDGCGLLEYTLGKEAYDILEWQSLAFADILSEDVFYWAIGEISLYGAYLKGWEHTLSVLWYPARWDGDRFQVHHELRWQDVRHVFRSVYGR